MTLSMRFLPRYPSRIVGAGGITTARSGPDVVITSDYGSLVRIPAVDNEATTFFKVWNQDNDSYSIMTFEDVIAAIGDVTGVMAVATYDPQGIGGDAFARTNHTGEQAISTVTGLQPALDAKAAISTVDGKVVYTVKTGAYTALAADNNAVLRFTAAATLSLTAAATLAANWHITVVANGGAVTIDPNGSETINGLATMIIPDGCSAEIICDGSNFFTVIRSSGFIPIERRSFSAVSAVDFTGLGWKSVRVRGRVGFSGVTDWFWRSSTNNGSSYDAGASDYSSQILSAVGATTGAARQTAAAYALISVAQTDVVVDMLFDSFNDSGGCTSIANLTSFDSGGIFTQRSSQFRADTAARNALRFAPVSAVTMTGYLTIEGSVS